MTYPLNQLQAANDTTEGISAWKTDWNIAVSEIMPILRSEKSLDDDEFNSAALSLFRYQSRHNIVYRDFLEDLGAKAPNHWKEIVPLPVMAFKHQIIVSFPVTENSPWFQTSGTTSDTSGRHYFHSLDLYEQALIPAFKEALLPDCDKIQMLILTPPPEEAPHSSLTHMMETVRKHFGTESSRYFWENGKLDFNGLDAALSQSMIEGKPIMIPGTAFAFVHLVEYLVSCNRTFQLPSGSRVMETGGFKGKSREMPRDELYGLIGKSLGIPPEYIINEYGMTELSSQFYDFSLHQSAATEWKTGPSWCRAVVIDPITGREMPSMQEGIICLYDLANVGSCMALRTEDAGVMDPEGRLKVVGRIARTTPRGCSIGSDHILSNS